MAQEPERKFYLTQFRAISQAISTYEDFNLLVSHLVEGVCRTFGVKGASILILDEQEQQLFRVCSYGIGDDYLNKGPIFADSKYCTLDTGKVEIVEDMQNDERVQYPAEALKEGVGSMMVVPIKYRKTVIGMMRIYHNETLKLHEDDIDSLCVLSSHLGLVIQNNGLKNFVDQVKMTIDSLPSRIFNS